MNVSAGIKVPRYVHTFAVGIESFLVLPDP